MLISDPFSLNTKNNFNSSPPFGLFDIFTSVTVNRNSPPKSHLMAIDYSMTVKWNPCFVLHVYVSKVKPFMKLKTDEGKKGVANG